MASRKKHSEPTSNLRVAVRIRPMNGTERSEKCTNVVKVDKGKQAIELKGKSFGPFFRTYDPDTTQEEIYSDLVSSQIKKVIAGFNCTVFAYGQTGTGKTFTMEGGRTDAKSSTDDPTTGIIPRAVEDIFEQLERCGCEEYSLRVSYIELYNEELFDLLASTDNEDRERLRIFDDPNKKGVIVSGVEEVPVRNRSDVFKLLQLGAEKRRTAATLMNMHSSRSHSLFMVNVVIRENTTTGEELVKQGKLNLVDLAGSENIGRSGAQGNRAKEAGSINQSLLTLGRVIRLLTTNGQHIPYRESKLTRLLQDSLGGSTITSLIATLSPSSSNFEESQSTLEYAMRAANIKNKPVCNTKLSKKTILKEYSDEIEKLRRDLRAAREKNGVIISQESHDEFQKNSEKVQELEQHLDNAVDRLRIFTEDQMHMDEQYRQLYERKGELEDRLRDRIREMAVKEKELADTNDVLNKHIEVIGLMHTSALKAFDQLTTSQGAADEMQTDLRAFWRKVDEMERADDRNKIVIDHFSKKMSDFIDTTSKLTNSLKADGDLLSKKLSENICPHVKSMESAHRDIESTAMDMETHAICIMKKSSEAEKKVIDNMTAISMENRIRLETVMKTCDDFYKSYSAKSQEFTQMVVDKLDEVKKQVSDFTEDMKPLVSTLHQTTCDSYEARTNESKKNVEHVRAACSSMADSMKALMLQVEQLSTKVAENHEKQVIADQNNQETILDTLNTAETVVQSLEDNIVETCDVKQEMDDTKKTLKQTDAKQENHIQVEKERAEEKENEVKVALKSFSDEAEATRGEAREFSNTLKSRFSATSEKCKVTGELVSDCTKKATDELSSLLDEFTKSTIVVTKESAAVVNSVVLVHVDPSVNVPQRILPSFPLVSELNQPVEPEVLLGFGEGNDDFDTDELATKKRRVTSFVRRDSLLETTNNFLSPSSIIKRREQAIEEEEDFEN
ncbi:Kinesin-like protein [Caenorhabditis elegans]|nr:Kinesin-like protein [Caenorhabditis elegans]AAG03081.1 bimC kinesin BMK-1 [Caenorhabditis elegans]BAC19818.1 kinesin like protein KLP-14 [Caenorhabditis elegans]CAB01170.1 Kinesin-like protein [Caenorhabditis elegans]|eukprot:NP_001256586.1 Kinesin-like protein [Caenorhabditis elegans]